MAIESDDKMAIDIATLQKDCYLLSSWSGLHTYLDLWLQYAYLDLTYVTLEVPLLHLYYFMYTSAARKFVFVNVVWP